MYSAHVQYKYIRTLLSLFFSLFLSLFLPWLFICLTFYRLYACFPIFALAFYLFDFLSAICLFSHFCLGFLFVRSFIGYMPARHLGRFGLLMLLLKNNTFDMDVVVFFLSSEFNNRISSFLPFFSSFYCFLPCFHLFSIAVFTTFLQNDKFPTLNVVVL